MIQMYVDLFREKLLEQKSVYESAKNGDYSTVCYKQQRNEEFGTSDEHYLNRERLAYYMLYEHQYEESVVIRLFEEELTDRETNSFQGVGNTILILTTLLNRFDKTDKHEELYTRAENANFDCAGGYDRGCNLNDDIYQQDFYDYLFDALELKYIDTANLLFDEFQKNVTDWDLTKRRNIISLNEKLGRYSENERLYLLNLQEVQCSGKVFDIASAYKDIIKYYLDNGRFEQAYCYFMELTEQVNLDEIKHIRLFSYIVEYGCEIICGMPSTAKTVWDWVKPAYKSVKNKFGNLYKKALATANAVGDSYAEEIQAEYLQWKKDTEIK